MSTAQRFIRRSMAKGVIVATLLLPLPSFSRPSSPQLVVISRMGPNSVHVERTQGEFRDTINLMFDRVPEGVHIEGTYRSSNGSELHYRAQVAPKGGYVSIHEVSAQEVFTVRFARRDLEGCAYGQLVSVRFGDREVAVDEGALERNLPQLVEIAEALRQSRMLPLILDSQSLIQAAREKIAQRSAKKYVSQLRTRGLSGELLLGVFGMRRCGDWLCGEYSWHAQLRRPNARLCPQYPGPPWYCFGLSGRV